MDLNRGNLSGQLHLLGINFLYRGLATNTIGINKRTQTSYSYLLL